MFSEIKLEKTILKINFYLICFFLNFFGSSDSSGILAYLKSKLAETRFFFFQNEKYLPYYDKKQMNAVQNGKNEMVRLST